MTIWIAQMLRKIEGLLGQIQNSNDRLAVQTDPKGNEDSDI